MVFLQFYLTTTAQIAGVNYTMNPVIVKVPLYGKYKTKILSIQYYGDVNTVIQIQSRQLALPIVGSDQLNLNVASRFPYLMIGSYNVSPPHTGTEPWTFYTDWDGVFEYIIYDVIAKKPLISANFDACDFIINLDVEPVDTPLQNSTINQFVPSEHMFTQLPSKTFKEIR
jgi:hypothetical protein